MPWQSVGQQPIAEGVESEEHGEFLLQLGCEHPQGYGIAKPLPAAELRGWAERWQLHTSWRQQRAVARDDLPVLFAMVEHRAWDKTIDAAIRGVEMEAPEIDEQRCPVVRWLNREGVERYQQHPAFDEIDTLHLQIHTLANSLLSARQQRRDREAVAGLAELYALRDWLFAALKSLLQAPQQSTANARIVQYWH